MAERIPDVLARQVELLNASQLVDKTYVDLKQRFGIEIPVTTPSADLPETQRVAEGEGLRFFDPTYFLRGKFTKRKVEVNGQKMNYPKGWVKSRNWYWHIIYIMNEGSISRDVVQMDGFWTLFDRSKRPSYQNKRQMFEGDERLGGILKRFREIGENGGIAVPDDVRDVPVTSRFAVSPQEQDTVVFPELARVLRLTEKIALGRVEVRTPTATEFNYAGNLRYPYLGEANTSEWFANKFADVARLLGGNSGSRPRGLANVLYFWSDARHAGTAFRPLVRFSPAA